MERTPRALEASRRAKRVRGRRVVAFVVGLALAAAGLSMRSVDSTADAETAAGSRGPAASVTYRDKSTTTMELALPSGAQVGDVLVASLGFGNGGASQPTLTAPPGFTLATRVNQAKVAAAVYTHVLAAGETSFTWTASSAVGGEGFLAAFHGIDTATPVAAVAGHTVGAGSTVATPTSTTPVDNSVVVASFVGYRAKKKRTTWSTPSGMAEIGDASDSAGNHAGSLDQVVQASAGSTGSKQAKASNSQDGSIGIVTVLRPEAAAATTTTVAPTTTAPTTTAPTTTTTTVAPPPPGAVPTIIDTDLFSDADDVGALATAFGLQQRGEAKVIAIGINTRTSRPAVATNSWKCAAAVSSFYGSSSVPIGTAMPNNGTSVNTVDFLGPCARLAPASTPVPSSAVSVFRKALAAQPDASVVVIEAGYAGNLAALLTSPADSFSPLNGRDLVAQKVKRLTFMGGGYPQRSGENNLQGDPAAAQVVASSWPGRIVWDGYEVGDAIHTGNTISATHPASSPVRVAYEAFVGPNNWIYSYDLVAAFDAIRTSDSSLSEVGPGTNTVNSAGGNTFTQGSGQQYYLKLNNSAALTAAIEQLITTLPAATPPPPPPPPPPPSSGPSDTFDSGSLSSQWTTSTNGSTVKAANQQLEITHPSGGWTSGTVSTASPFDPTGRSVRVQLKRAANGGLSGSTYGETSVRLAADPTHYVEFFVAGGSLTAWVQNGSSSTNLTPNWPRYDPVAMQWLRFRESGGKLYWEYAAGATAPGSWTVLASAADPFALTSVSLSMTAGANVSATDTAIFDNVSTG